MCDFNTLWCGCRHLKNVIWIFFLSCIDFEIINFTVQRTPIWIFLVFHTVFQLRYFDLILRLVIGKFLHHFLGLESCWKEAKFHYSDHRKNFSFGVFRSVLALDYCLHCCFDLNDVYVRLKDCWECWEFVRKSNWCLW